MKLLVTMQTTAGETIACQLMIWKRRGEWIFEKLEIKE